MDPNESTPAEQPQTAPTPPVDNITPAPAAPAAPAPAEGGQPAPAEPAAPAEGEPAPASSAPAVPEPPRESASAKRARELRERTAGMNALADRLDPPAPAAAPAAPAPLPATTPSQPDYLDDDGNVDIPKLNAYNERRAREIATEVIQQNRSVETITNARNNYVESVNRDAQAIAAQYDELNPLSANYDAELDDHLIGMYQSATTNASGQVVRIDIPMKDFVDREMKVIRKYRTQSAAATPNTVAGQAVDGAIVPSAGSQKTVEKPYKEMSRKEREAKLGFARIETPPIK